MLPPDFFGRSSLSSCTYPPILAWPIPVTGQFMPSVFSYSEAVSHPLGLPQPMLFDLKLIISW
jgi:hypothetical protein